jgi:transcriptional regulator with XRE-family HTH domain
LAAKARISRGYLARLETARNDPTLSMLMKIAKALRVKVGRLLD